MSDVQPANRARRRDNMLASLVFNIIVPGFVFSKLSDPERLGPTYAMLVGILFPLAYGLYDLVTRHRWNLFSLVGVASVSITGGFAVMNVDGIWFAIKEASIPALFGIAVLATIGTGRPLIREIVLSESVFDVDRLEAELAARGTRREFDALLRTATLWMAAAFALSALLNFGLARVMLVSPAGTPEFAAELGHMTWMSWPVIALPSMVLTMLILWRLLAGIHELTGLDAEELMHKREQSS